MGGKNRLLRQAIPTCEFARVRCRSPALFANLIRQRMRREGSSQANCMHRVTIKGDAMKKSTRSPRRVNVAALAFTILAPAVMSLYALHAWGGDITATLSGAQEVPPVKTSATGTAMLTIGGDRSVSGTLTTTGIEATAAHIHEAPSGKNGGVIVPFVKSGDKWTIPPGAKLTEPQFKSFQDGNLYVNVHSAANKDGEIRAQLKP
jgi:hypothetical protein